MPFPLSLEDTLLAPKMTVAEAKQRLLAALVPLAAPQLEVIEDEIVYRGKLFGIPGSRHPALLPTTGRLALKAAGADVVVTYKLTFTKTNVLGVGFAIVACLFAGQGGGLSEHLIFGIGAALGLSSLYYASAWLTFPRWLERTLVPL